MILFLEISYCSIEKCSEILYTECKEHTKEHTMNSNIRLSENISELRRKKNITQEELAEFMGVTKASVSKWERGSRA